jgi:ferredoxin
MAYVITRLCQRAGECAQVCPQDAIHFVEGDPAWPTYYINPDPDNGCIECGACEAACPHEAIFHQDDVPAEYHDDIQKNADYYRIGPGKDQV